MKKLLAMSMCVAVAAGALTGCAKSTNDETAYDLSIAGLKGGYGSAGWEAVVKAFEEENDVKVNLKLSEKIADELRPDIQAGNVPDLIYLSVGSEGGLTDTMIKEKQVLEISDVLDMDIPGEDTKVSEKLIPGIEEGLNTMPYGDGKLYLAPINYGPCGLYYNA